MSTMLPDFDARLAAWLDDEEETGLPEGNGTDDGLYLARPSDGALAAIKALAEAQSDEHADHPMEERIFPVVCRVIGKDLVDTMFSVPVGTRLACFLGALSDDATVEAVRVLGFEAPVTADPVDEPMEPDYATAPDTVDVPEDIEVVVTWLGDEDDDEPWPTFPSVTPRPAEGHGYGYVLAAATVATAGLLYLAWRTLRRAR